MSHEIENKSVTVQSDTIKSSLSSAVIGNKRVSIPIEIGLLVIITTQFITASSSSFLWFLHSWGPYLGAISIAYGVFPLIADVDDEGGDGPVPFD